jgi:hypothetical protein
MPITSDDIGLGRITAGRSDCVVWACRAPSGVAWGRCHLLRHWARDPPPRILGRSGPIRIDNRTVALGRWLARRTRHDREPAAIRKKRTGWGLRSPPGDHRTAVTPCEGSIVHTERAQRTMPEHACSRSPWQINDKHAADIADRFYANSPPTTAWTLASPPMDFITLSGTYGTHSTATGHCC